MPIYEYRCEACGHCVEVLQKISDDPPSKCEACGESVLKKLVSRVVFRLAGKGWYETDFKTGDKRNLVEQTTNKVAGADNGGKKNAKSDASKSQVSSARKKQDSKTSVASG